MIPDLTDAWRTAENACPKGWYIFGVRAMPMSDNEHLEDSMRYAVGEPDRPLWWNAAARGPDTSKWITGAGPNPPEALLDLAKNLGEA